MKAIEILSENKQIAEGPASMLGQAAKRIGAAALGAAGLKTWAGQLDSKADVGQFANRYYKEYQRYLRTAGRPEAEATLGDLKDFMLKNGITTQNIPPNLTGSADKDSVFAILNKTAQEYIKGSGSASGSVGAVDTTAGAGNNTAAQTTAPGSNQPQTQQSTPGAQTPTNPSNQPFSIPALLQVIPQMRKKDLNKIISAAQTALQNPAAASSNAATSTAPINTSNMTPAQIRATKQAQAANAAQAQMKANPVPATPVAQTPAQIRAEKQKVAAANAQSQMAAPKPAAAPAPQSSVKVSAPRRARRKVAVAV